MPDVTITVKDSTGVKTKMTIKCKERPTVEVFVDDEIDNVQVIDFSTIREDERAGVREDEREIVPMNVVKNVVEDEESKA